MPSSTNLSRQSAESIGPVCSIIQPVEADQLDKFRATCAETFGVEPVAWPQDGSGPTEYIFRIRRGQDADLETEVGEFRLVAIGGKLPAFDRRAAQQSWPTDRICYEYVDNFEAGWAQLQRLPDVEEHVPPFDEKEVPGLSQSGATHRGSVRSGGRVRAIVANPHYRS
jgi:hypothetical protein